MVTIERVINSTRVMGVRVAISRRHCIAFEVLLLLPAGCHGNQPVLNLFSAHWPKISIFALQEKLWMLF